MSKLLWNLMAWRGERIEIRRQGWNEARSSKDESVFHYSGHSLAFPMVNAVGKRVVGVS